MGRNSKKKKGGASRHKGRSRATPNDRFGEDDQDLLSEEITALSAIFQEDFKILSRSSQIHIAINLRPHSDATGYENQNVSAILSVRCLPGYPFKCPKLQVEPEKGLMQVDVDKLLSLLLDQANSNSREGRVMIFNLVEVAQEFLSEILSAHEPSDFAPSLVSGEKEKWFQRDLSTMGRSSEYVEESFVSGLYDLFSEFCGDDGSWHHGIGTVVNDDKKKIARDHISDINKDQQNTVSVHNFDTSRIGNVVPRMHQFLNYEARIIDVSRNVQVPSVLDESYNPREGMAGRNGSTSTKDSTTSPWLKSVRNDFEKEIQTKEVVNSMTKDIDTDQQIESSYSGLEDETSNILATSSLLDDKKDLFMAYLLRLFCSTKRSLTLALPEITSELCNLGMLSEKARDLSSEPPSTFNKIFNSTFQPYMASSQVIEFWKASIDFTQETSPVNSRYLSDFEEIRYLGHGGFGHVVLCKNKLDGRQYAVKKIRLKNKSSPFNEKILREVATLARLQHQHVVRYYQAWFETEIGCHVGSTARTSMAGESSDGYFGSFSTNAAKSQIQQDSMYLYIQMEYCPRTLRQDFENYQHFLDKELNWHLFRQIVEGLAHIHSHGIIHRDLTPNNIFFDARNDIKIGDFGLAKFLKLEQSDQDPSPSDVTGNSVDRTGQVGTYFYTAPEIEQGWPHINEKVDMYSLGVVFFELWHPFGTAMERHAILSDLKLKAIHPPAWVTKFPEQSSIVQRLMSPLQSKRPSARELLQTALPPRMEDEWLNDILRTIQTSEDTYVYDQVISTIFDEERITLKGQRQHVERDKVTQDESSFAQYTKDMSAFRDIVTEASREVFRKHGSMRLEITPICLLDGYQHPKRKVVKVLSSSGNMLELCHELRSPFISWVVKEQILSFKRHEISWVHRRGVGHSAPNRFLQGDFDIVGGAPSMTAAEAIKVALDLGGFFFNSDHLDIHLNHGQLLAAIWSWVGIEGALRQNVANVISSLSSYSPQSAKRKSDWVLIRRQLLQGLSIPKSVVDKLQAVDLRFCGPADQSLARLRGALLPGDLTRNALEDISLLIKYLRVWKIVENIYLDVLMPPEESYYRGIYFQIYFTSDSNFGSMSGRNLLALGGCYDHLLHAMWYHKSTPPSVVGVSIGLENIILHFSDDMKPSSLFRNESNTTVLVCSRGGGGFLEERMELVDELWKANIKADFVPLPNCSLTTQYDYASDHGIKLLVVITEAGLLQTNSVEVRHPDLKKEKKVERSLLIKFLTDAISTQFRSSSIWNQ